MDDIVYVSLCLELVWICVCWYTYMWMCVFYWENIWGLMSVKNLCEYVKWACVCSCECVSCNSSPVLVLAEDFQKPHLLITEG